MIKNDQQYAVPFNQLRDVQATIDAITPLQGGMIAYATDSDKFGFYTPSSFKWLTIPASGTLALLGTANVFTTVQKINVDSATAFLVEQDGVQDNVLVVDTTNGRVGVTRLYVGSADNFAKIKVNSTLVENSTSEYGIYSQISLAPTANNTAAPKALNFFIDTSTAFNFTSEVSGAAGSVRHSGTGVITSAIGFRVGLQLNNNTGSITRSRLFYAVAPLFIGGSNKTVQDNYGFYGGNQGNANITNSYGLYLENQSGSATLNYALFTNAGLNKLGDQLNIDGSADRIQLIVQGHSTQNTNLQEWQNSSGIVLSSVNGSGWLAIGSTSAAAPIYNISSQTVTTTTNGIASFAEINPSGATSAAHYGAQIQLKTAGTYDFTSTNGIVGILGYVTHRGNGTVANAYGFVGQIQINTGTTGVITNASAIQALSPSRASGTNTITTLSGLNVGNMGAAFVTNAYGLYIQPQSGAATLNYAIFTNAGLVHFGDTVDLASGKNLTLLAGNITTDTTTGTKIGTATSQKLGFWNATPVNQPAGATQAAPAAYATGAFGLDSNANMQALYDLVVAMRTALVNTGIMKGAA